MSKIALSIIPFVLLCLIAVEGIYQVTEEKIIQQQQKTLTDNISQVFPLSKDEELKAINLSLKSYANIPLSPSAKKPNTSRAWLVCRQEDYRGMILSIRSTQGYSGNIDLLIGINEAMQIVGLHVLKHQETPGLGDKIEGEKSDWLKQFIGHSANSSSWQLKRGHGTENQHTFDAITAATITSKAVISLLKNALSELSELEITKTNSPAINCLSQH